MNLKSMNQEVAIPLHFIQSNLLNKPRDEIDIGLITTSLPKLFDSCSNFFCYSFNQINQEDQLIELQNMIKESFLGKNVYAREVAGQVVSLGAQVQSKMANYFNVQKAGQIDGASLLQEHLTRSLKMSSNY